MPIYIKLYKINTQKKIPKRVVLDYDHNKKNKQSAS